MKHLLLTLTLVGATLTACHRTTFDERMKQETEAYTAAHLPRQMDNNTIETSRRYEARGRVLIDEMAVVAEGQDLKALFTPEVREEVRQSLRQNLKYDIAAKTMKDSNVVFVYRYIDGETREKLFDIRLTPEEYK